MPSPLESKNAFTCSWYTMASMYQSGSPGWAVGGSAEACGARARVSTELAPDGEDVGRLPVRVQHHEVGCAAPRVALAREQVVDAEICVGHESQLGEVQRHPAALHVVRVEVHHHEQRVIAGAFRVRDERRVVGRMEDEAPVRL